MSYEDESGDFEDSGSADYLDDAALDEEGSSDDDTEVHRSMKGKDKSSEHALEVRRAIEDHAERSRLQKELDYLYDEEFTEGE